MSSGMYVFVRKEMFLRSETLGVLESELYAGVWVFLDFFRSELHRRFLGSVVEGKMLFLTSAVPRRIPT